MSDSGELETVLIVDDDPLFLRPFAKSWARFTRAVRTAVTVEQAIASLSLGGVDLVVTDFFLERQTGLELVAAIQTMYPLTPVVVMSGALEIDHAIDAMRLGAADVVEKGLLPSDILRRLRRTDDPALRRYRRAEQSYSLHANERQLIDSIIARTGGNISAAARLLGIHTTTLRRKLEKTPSAPRSPDA